MGVEAKPSERERWFVLRTMVCVEMPQRDTNFVFYVRFPSLESQFCMKSISKVIIEWQRAPFAVVVTRIGRLAAI